MELPVIFLAFANDTNDPLELLDEERKTICEHLIPLESEQYFQLYREPTASTDDIVKYLTEFKDRVSIFHYGGHADSKRLMLAKQEASSDGIAQLLAQQKNLQLVFLNGCSTKAQVDLLLDLGIPAVIATSVPVNDQTAKDLADKFYHAMANKHSMKEAFEMAASAAKAKTNADIKIIYRGLASRGETDTATFPWGLYINEDKKEVLDWKLPLKSFKNIIIEDTIVAGSDKKFEVNKKLTQGLFEALAPYNDYLEFAMFKAQKGEQPDIRKIRQAIMDCLPAPIGDQIRRLFALDEVSRDRLEQLVTTYGSLTELLLFALLSQLWDLKFSQPDFKVPEESKEVVAHYFKMEKEEMSFYDYLHLISALRKIFDANEVHYFIDELGHMRQLMYDDEQYADAHQFLQMIKQQLYKDNAKFDADELNALCLHAEDHLSYIFKTLGFLVKYKLVTVKDIGLIKERHKAPEYRVKKVFLDNITAGLLDEESMSTTFTATNSVILLKSKKNLTEYLNLSPFIIDENALIGEKKSKLFFFSHFDINTEDWHYKFAYNTADKLCINDEKYPDVKSDLNSFSQLIFG